MMDSSCSSPCQLDWSREHPSTPDKASGSEISTPEYYTTSFDQTVNQSTYDTYNASLLMPSSHQDAVVYAAYHSYSPTHFHVPEPVVVNPPGEYIVDPHMISGTQTYQSSLASMSSDLDMASPPPTFIHPDAITPPAITPPAMMMVWEGAFDLEGFYHQLIDWRERFGDAKIPDELLMPFLDREALQRSDIGKGSRNGAKHFVCRWPNCGKLIHRADHGRDHIRSHVDNRPYKCPEAQCESRFIRDYDRKRHIKSLHKPLRGSQNRRIATVDADGHNGIRGASTSIFKKD